MAANQHKSRKKRGLSDTQFVIIGAFVIAVLLAVLIVIKLSGQKGENVDLESSGEAELISDDIIMLNAAIDLSAVMPDGGESIIKVKGMTPGEISSLIKASYDWDLMIVNKDANVGASVLTTVDAFATTEAATMGDEDNPDGMLTNDEELTEELIVTESIEVPDLILTPATDLINTIIADNESYLLTKSLTPTETETETKKSLFKKETEESTEETEEEELIVYTLSFPDLSDEIAEISDKAETLWYEEATGGSIGSYDKDSDSFIMETPKSGFEVDKELLSEYILSAIKDKDFTRSIAVPGYTTSAESNITVGDYQILATYTTSTTSNSVRNKNIRLACEAVNGTIVRPGEEFSFNNTVGQRTEAKGYGEAAAYNNGEVVQEIGGGVCQVSTTLYNAVVKAGLKVTARQSHTFQPTYVTPGLDATISWGGPDFKFANIPANYDYSYSQSYAIGIRASYSNQKVTVSIYGRPVLKSGYTYSLSSEKTKELDLVRELITPDSDKEPATGTKGSVWETRLVIKKDGETVSNNVDHMSYYTGHTEYYYEEVPTEPESESESETDEIISDVPLGPGGSSSGPGVIYGPGTIIYPTETEAPSPAETETEAYIEEPAPGEAVYISDDGPGSIS